MCRLDADPRILSWSSEPVAIRYRSPEDGKPHRYYPDFWIRVAGVDGVAEELLVEVKPAHQTVPPTTDGKSKKRLIRESLTYAKNAAKWEAAEAYCTARGWRFVKMTERELDIPAARWKKRR